MHKKIHLQKEFSNIMGYKMQLYVNPRLGENGKWKKKLWYKLLYIPSMTKVILDC
jgi:hypothetical protein